jgi:hypothetical protein
MSGGGWQGASQGQIATTVWIYGGLNHARLPASNAATEHAARSTRDRNAVLDQPNDCRAQIMADMVFSESLRDIGAPR